MSGLGHASLSMGCLPRGQSLRLLDWLFINSSQGRYRRSWFQPGTNQAVNILSP